MENCGELRASVNGLAVYLLDLNLRLKAIERMLWRLDPGLAASCQVDQVSAPLTGESPAPSGAPSDPGTRSG